MNHSECQGWRKQRTLPTRLVHVHRVDGRPEIVANICHCEKLSKATTYLTLSHCWGDIKFVTTTRSNLSQFETRLPVESLSQTMQDAMLVTLEMGFNYVWIDSLCIIQDDTDDWTKEASRMGDVYRSASCNISASAFANGEHGFTRPRVLDPTPIFAEMRWSIEKGTDGENTFDETYYFTFEKPEEEIAYGLLFERAWT
jgi:hypothetical protein